MIERNCRVGLLSLVAVALFSTSVVFAAPRPQRAKKAVKRPPQTAPAPSGAALSSIRIEPQEATLTGARAPAQLIVTGVYSDTSLRDLTRQKDCKYAVKDPKIAKVDANGVVTPLSDGTTTVTATVGGKSVGAKVKVRDVKKSIPINFYTEVEPVLSKAGCNMGACHGAQHGKGGFKLSLLAYDPEFDWRVIVKQSESRRIHPQDPERSLLLLKPTMGIAHGGGKRFDQGSFEYDIIKGWIEDGTPPPSDRDRWLTRIEVVPAERTLTEVGQEQQLIVKAYYDDGSVEDVTRKARFNSNEEAVATVGGGVGYNTGTPGLVRVVGKGESAIMVRYMGAVGTSRLLVPYRWPIPAGQRFQVHNVVDEMAAKEWRKLAIEPSQLCSDEEFIRRVMFDICGALPTADEARRFIADSDPKKRSRLIDALLDYDPEYAKKIGDRDYYQLYVDFWTLKWGDLFRINRDFLTDKGMYNFQQWIRDAVYHNKPYDVMVREMLIASGSVFDNPAANYYRLSTDPQSLTETTTQALLGIRIGCARCHNHPFEKWTQNDYYGFAAFFARVRTSNPYQTEYDNKEMKIFTVADGEVNHPKTNKVMPPRALDALPVFGLTPEDDRRVPLAEWITSPDNKFFVQCIANRVWRHLMGRGIFEPVDDQRVTNPPTNPELLEAISDYLVEKRFDLKELIRLIANARTYQLSFRPNPWNERDDRFYSRYIARRLSAEQLLDAVSDVTLVREKFGGLPLLPDTHGYRAISLPDNKVDNYFLNVFGRPPRTISCECERTAAPNIAQALHLMNSPTINSKIANEKGRVSALMQSGRSDREIVEELYLCTVSRFPTKEEMARAEQQIAQSPSRKSGVEDVLWALLNTKEFVFNH